MKLFKTSFFFITLIVFTVCVSNLFAQDGYVNSFDGSDVPLVEKPNSFVPEDNVPIFNGNPQEITDEYGSQLVNRACNFGTGSTTRRVQIPSHSVFANQGVDGSIEMWVYPTSNSNMLFFSKGNTSATTGYYLGYSTNASVRLFFRIGGPNPGYFWSGQSLTFNTWTHIAVTWISVAGGFTCRFYKNGVLVATETETCTWFSNNDPVLIGGNNAYSSNYMRGLIDEVRFWGPQRTTTQIRYNRFVGIGDHGAANIGNALTSSTHYNACAASWTFNFSSGYCI